VKYHSAQYNVAELLSTLITICHVRRHYADKFMTANSLTRIK